MWCLGSNPDQAHAVQVPYPLDYHSGSLILFFDYIPESLYT